MLFNTIVSIAIVEGLSADNKNVELLNLLKEKFPDIRTMIEIAESGGYFGSDNSDYLSNVTGFIGFSGDDNASGDSNDNVLFGGYGNDKLNGKHGNDILHGEEGDDHLYGDLGDDVLIGDAGNDYMYGGRGNDVYVMSRGFGSDHIYEFASKDSGSDPYDELSVDTIKFNDIKSNEIKLKVNQSDTRDLLISVIGSDDQLILKDYLTETNQRVDRIEFSDGEVWSKDYILQKVMRLVTEGTDSGDLLKGTSAEFVTDVILGQGGADYLKGDDGNDELYGGDDDDHLYGESGDDILSGDAGTDYLEGGRGNDTYVMNRGFGIDRVNDFVRQNSDNDPHDELSVDTIKFNDIKSSEVELRVDQLDTSDLQINVIGSDDQLILDNFFYGSKHIIDKIEFSDGEIWLKNDLIEKTKRLTTKGTDSDDELNGTSAELVTDVLLGYGGSDQLYGDSGDDELYGGDGNDLLHGGNGDDQVYGDNGNDELYGNDGSDKIYGGLGNDYLYGEDGDDILEGSTGNDILIGGRGNDTYILRSGFGHDIINENAYDRWGHSSDEEKYDVASIDTIVFEDIRSDQLTWQVCKDNSANLELLVENTNDKLNFERISI